MRFGAHCVLYGEKIKTDTEDVIRRLSGTGAKGCEIGQRFFGADKRDELTDILKRHGMELAGMHCNGVKLTDLLEHPEISKESLEAVAKFVAPLPDKNIIATGGVELGELRQAPISKGAPDKRLHDERSVRKLAKELNDMAAYIKAEYDVQVHYHNHSWEFADEGLIWYAIAEEAPSVKFALDTGWASIMGYNVLELIRRYPDRFSYVHLRDFSSVDTSKCFDDVHKGFVSIGSGLMNYPMLIAELEELLPEDAWAIVEYELGNFDENSYLSAINYLNGLQDMYHMLHEREKVQK